MACTTHPQKMVIDEKIRDEFFLRRFSHMQGTFWEWNVEKLEGVHSQILVTCPLHAVNNLLVNLVTCAKQCLAGLRSRAPDMPGHHLVPKSRDLMYIPNLCSSSSTSSTTTSFYSTTTQYPSSRFLVVVVEIFCLQTFFFRFMVDILGSFYK